MNIRIKKLHENASIPRYMTELAAGFDLTCVEVHTIGADGYGYTGLK